MNAIERLEAATKIMITVQGEDSTVTLRTLLKLIAKAKGQ